MKFIFFKHPVNEPAFYPRQPRTGFVTTTLEKWIVLAPFPEIINYLKWLQVQLFISMIDIYLMV